MGVVVLEGRAASAVRGPRLSVLRAEVLAVRSADRRCRGAVWEVQAPVLWRSGTQPYFDTYSYLDTNKPYPNLRSRLFGRNSLVRLCPDNDRYPLAI